MSILVNGSPMDEISIQRELKQGDLLTPFLILFVVDGFSGLIQTAVSLNMFEGFQFSSENVEVSHLQYGDGTLCIGKATVNNLWTLKALLKGFEMASGLKINFSKSCLIGVNVASEFMDMACTFLDYSQGSIPFKYFGLLVSAKEKVC